MNKFLSWCYLVFAINLIKTGFDDIPTQAELAAQGFLKLTPNFISGFIFELFAAIIILGVISDTIKNAQKEKEKEELKKKKEDELQKRYQFWNKESSFVGCSGCG